MALHKAVADLVQAVVYRTAYALTGIDVRKVVGVADAVYADHFEEGVTPKTLGIEMMESDDSGIFGLIVDGPLDPVFMVSEQVV